MFDVVLQLRVDTEDEAMAADVLRSLSMIARASLKDPARPNGIPPVTLRMGQVRRLSADEAKDPKDLTAELVRGITSALSKAAGDDTEGWKGGTT